MSDPALEDAIRALAHPGRQAMLRLIWTPSARPPTSPTPPACRGPRQPAPQVLREAGLIAARVDATRRLYRADLARVAEVASFLDDFWAAPLDRLKAAAERPAAPIGAPKAGAIVKLAVQRVVINAPPGTCSHTSSIRSCSVTGWPRAPRWIRRPAASSGGRIPTATPSRTLRRGRPTRRVVFTYGWERAEVQIPPGSTTVEIRSVTQADGATLVTLVHRGLGDRAAHAHTRRLGALPRPAAAHRRR